MSTTKTEPNSLILHVKKRNWNITYLWISIALLRETREDGGTPWGARDGGSVVETDKTTEDGGDAVRSERRRRNAVRRERVVVLFGETRSVVGFNPSSVTEKRRRRERRRRIGGGGLLVVSIGIDHFSVVTENTKRKQRWRRENKYDFGEKKIEQKIYFA